MTPEKPRPLVVPTTSTNCPTTKCSTESSAPTSRSAFVHPEFRELALGLDLRLGEVTALRLGHVLGLARADAELNRVVLVLLLGAHRDHLAVVHLEHGHGHVVALRVEHAGHPELLGDETGTHDCRLSCSV